MKIFTSAVLICFFCSIGNLANADVTEEDLTAFLTNNNSDAKQISDWKLDCLDALSGRLDNREDIPKELLTLMQTDCEIRFEQVLKEFPALNMGDLKNPKVAQAAARLDVTIRATAGMNEIQALKISIHDAEAVLPQFFEQCNNIHAILEEAKSAGHLLRIRTVPALCREGRANRLISDAQSALLALEDPNARKRFGMRPSEDIAKALTAAKSAYSDAKGALAAAKITASNKAAEVQQRLDLALREALVLSEELPRLHEELNQACETYNGVKPWACFGRAQARHRKWLQDSLATIKTLTAQDVLKSPYALKQAENYFFKIRKEIAEGMKN